MATKFHSKVVRVQDMGGKLVVEFKEKLVEMDKQEPVVDTNDVKLYSTVDEADTAIEEFMAG